MRFTSTALAAALAILAVLVHTSAGAAQEAPYGARSTAMPVPNAPVNGAGAHGGINAAPQYQSSPSYPHAPQPQPSYRQAYQDPQATQPAQGYASDPLPDSEANGFSPHEIKDAGHRFFGKVSSGFAGAVEYAFQRSGRPNGYIVGEEAGGAFVAGLRYGEGTLHTRDGGQYRVFWQGPSLGYDFGAEGSKTMVLVYNLHSPAQIYNTFAGVAGSAYLIGGVGVTYLERDDVVLAPIRSGVGLRLGANIGYLRYTRQPTWNPF